MKTNIFCCIAVIVFGLAVVPAEAQLGYGGFGGGGGVVSGAGVATIERQPEVMRLEIDILSQADSLKEALSGLKDRSTAARAQLLVLGVKKDSFKLGKPKIKGPSSQDQQIEQMLAARLRRGRGGARKPKKKESGPVTVSATLSASWELKSETVEELLLEIEPLQKKIRDADISGQKDASKLSPEQQEIIDELGANSFGGGGSGQAKPGDPLFLFVITVSDEERDRALAKGFQKAKRAAARLARAAGSELGELKSISASNLSNNNESEYGYNYESPLYQAMLKAQVIQQQNPNSGTAISAIPGTIVHKITVQARFDLKKE